MINKELASKQNLSEETIEKIEELHMKRKDYYNRMKIAPTHELKRWDKACSELEYDLQELWGFPRDSRYHKFWERPRCCCPQMDCSDAYPTGYYIINGDCLLHGGIE